MELRELQTFMAARGTKSPEQIAAFSAKLMAAHDEIVTYPALVQMLEAGAEDPESKPARRAISAALEAHARIYPGGVVYEDPLLGKPYLALRAKIEAFRGVKRDRRGAPIFTNDERLSKIDDLKAKIAEMLGPDADLSLTYGATVETWKAAIKRHQEFVEGKRKPEGTIWDFINSDAASPADLEQEVG